jgi:hypothetical protein
MPQHTINIFWAHLTLQTQVSHLGLQVIHVWKFSIGIAMNHTEFENEFEHNVEFIFEELDKFTNMKENPKKVEWGSSKERVIYRNDQDRIEFIREKPFIIRLSMNAKCGQVVNKEVRLQALRAVQKKINFSIERRELEALKEYQNSLLVPTLLFITLINYIFSLPSKIFTIATKEIIPFLPIFVILGTLILFFAKTIFENGGRSTLILQKRQLELVEQAIELAESRELAKV